MTENQLKICIFILCYNVAGTLPALINRIFVIDNDSEDNTYLVGIGYRDQMRSANMHIFKTSETWNTAAARDWPTPMRSKRGSIW